MFRSSSSSCIRIKSSTALLLVLSGALFACEWQVVDSGNGESSGQPSGSGSGSGAGGGGDVSCGLAGQTSCANAEPPASCDVKVDRWRELMVINQAVLLDHRTRNSDPGNGGNAGEWSFRARMEELAGSKANAPAFTHAWLDTWKTTTSVGSDYAPVTPRTGIDQALTNPWLTSSASYGSSDLDLAYAPFRLIAIVNRPDLREQVNGCDGRTGELRFVYTAEDKAKKAIAMTVIVEVPYPDTRTARGWMEAWHNLARLPFGAEYNNGLAALTEEVTSNAPVATWRVRTDEIAIGQASPSSGSASAGTSTQTWELREFGVNAAGHLMVVPLAGTPRMSLNNSASLDTWAQQSEAQIMNGSYVLPSALQAGSAPVPNSFFQWSQSSKMSDQLRTSLSMGTCNGCHGGERENETSLPFQHIAAPDQATQYYGNSQNGETRLSSYLNDENDQDHDELARRSKSMAAALCTQACAIPEEVPSSSSGGYQP